MPLSRPPLLSHPTTVVYVDDDTELLSLLPPSVGVLPYRTYSDAAVLLDDLDRGRLTCRLDLPYLPPRTDDSDDDEAAIGLDRWLLHLRVYNRRRFALASVMVIDYELPVRSGLALCQALTAYPVKRLMLTGRGGPELAVQALNDGLIDAYVEKSHPDLAREVADRVRGLQARAFAELVTPMVDLLQPRRVTAGHQHWCLDETLWALLRAHLRDCRAVEHYLIGQPPGFLIVDASGAAHLWLVFRDRQLTAQAERARRHGAPAAVVTRIDGRQAALFEPAMDLAGVSTPAHWWRSCVPILPVPGTDLFYGLTTDSTPFKIDAESVLSFQGYLAADLAYAGGARGPG